MRRGSAFGLGLALLLGGCGGGTSDEASTTTEAPEPSTTVAAAASPAACAADVAINAGFSKLFNNLPDGPPGAAPTPEIKAKVKAGYDAYLAKPLADFEANVPTAIATETHEAVAEVRRFADTGDGSILDSKDLAPKVLKIDSYMFANCNDGARTEVTAVDYGYQGLPARLKAGVNRFGLKNTGTETHEMGFLVKKAGVTDSFDAILALPQGKAMAKVDVVNFLEVHPGQVDYTSVDLKTGSYEVVCFVSKGTTADKPGDGPPHFTLGMKQEITVS